MMALHNALPRVGHLKALYHIFSHLSKYDHSNLIFDDQDSNVTDILFPQQDWTGFYGDVKEAIPSNRPKPRGRAVTIAMWGDSDHA